MCRIKLYETGDERPQRSLTSLAKRASPPLSFPFPIVEWQTTRKVICPGVHDIHAKQQIAGKVTLVVLRHNMSFHDSECPDEGSEMTMGHT